MNLVKKAIAGLFALIVTIAIALSPVLMIYFLQSAITTLIAYTLIALSAAALALVIINNERAYYRPPTILSLANDGDLPLVSVVIPRIMRIGQ